MRYLLLIVVCVIFPLFVAFPLDYRVTSTPIFLNSLIVGALSPLAAYTSIRNLSKFPGERSWMSMQPVVILWFGFFALMVMLLRIPHSVVYLVTGFIFCVVFVQIDYKINEAQKKMKIGYVPLGRAEGAEELPHALWIRMDKPTLDVGDVDAVVADLHSKDLSIEWQRFLAQCTLNHIPVYNIRQIEESLTGRVKIRHMYENDLGSLLPSETYSFIKRVCESALVVLALPLVLPIMLVTAAAIRIESRGAVIFTQRRVGQFGEEFTIYKFRSMASDSEKNGARFASKDDFRVTRVGRFIRKTRIDELPQFFNVLKGDMALIGPRPEQKVFVEEFEKLIPFYSYRHVVKPGITGWAQVEHGYAADADETQVKIEHDFYYIKNFSFGLDWLIVVKTIYTMMTGFGAR